MYNKDFAIDFVKDKLKDKKINLTDKDFFLPKYRQLLIEVLVVWITCICYHPGSKKMNILVLLPSIFRYVLAGSVQAAQAKEEA